MISLLDNGSARASHLEQDEEQLINSIYRFANKKEEWFNLLLSLSNCLSLTESLPESHPYKGLSGRLLTHLKNALNISTQLHTSSKHIDSTSVLNYIPMGAMIIDTTGRIVEISHLANDLVDSSEQLRQHGNYLLWQGDKSLNQILLETLSEASGSITLDLNLRCNAIHSNSKKRKLSKAHTCKLHITKIPTQTEDGLSAHFYCCFQTHNDTLIRSEQLRKHYELTETEALVVTTLTEELSSQNTANKLKLKEATVRGHLTNIYQKMGVSRKPELIRKVLLSGLIAHPEDCINNDYPNLSQPTQKNNLSHIYLRDGRKLSYSDHRPQKLVGDESNAPDNSDNLALKNISPKNVANKNIEPKNAASEIETILLLHNLMGSSLELPPGSAELFNRHQVRIIIPERPGYGDSDPHPGRTHKDWCDDINELLDNLKITRVKVIAHSIGGVYALAMTQYMPERVIRVAMVNAMTRVKDILHNKQSTPVLVTALLRSLRYAPFLIEPILKMAVGKDIEHFYEQQLSYIRPTQEGRAADINLLKTSAYRHYSIANLKQSAKQGIKIWADELRLSFAELGFDNLNKEIEFQFWHGNHDDVIPIAAPEKLALELNTLKFYRIDSETHFLFARQFENIVNELLS